MFITHFCSTTDPVAKDLRQLTGGLGGFVRKVCVGGFHFYTHESMDKSRGYQEWDDPTPCDGSCSEARGAFQVYVVDFTLDTNKEVALRDAQDGKTSPPNTASLTRHEFANRYGGDTE